MWSELHLNDHPGCWKDWLRGVWGAIRLETDDLRCCDNSLNSVLKFRVYWRCILDIKDVFWRYNLRLSEGLHLIDEWTRLLGKCIEGIFTEVEKINVKAGLERSEF